MSDARLSNDLESGSARVNDHYVRQNLTDRKVRELFLIGLMDQVQSYLDYEMASRQEVDWRSHMEHDVEKQSVTPNRTIQKPSTKKLNFFF